MPPSHEILTDDYVAELLAKEANDCSLKYSAMGLDAFKSDKRPAGQPKPNTCFLNNIIRNTASHNRALLARENAESRARLRGLEEADRRKRDAEERKERRSKPGPRDTRKRMLGDIAAILGGPSKRRRTMTTHDDDDDDSQKPAGGASGRDERDPRNKRDRKGKSREARRHREEEEEEKKDAKTKTRGGRDDTHSDSRDGDRHSRRRGERRRDRRSRSPREGRGDLRRRHRERSPRDTDDRHHRPHRRSDKEEERPRTPPSPAQDDGSDSDSDPLDDIIGPAPPSQSTVRRRGRGANASMSGIDGRFAADYDPAADVTPDPDEAGGGGGGGIGDDWDNAVEAFRDRQKWKRQGADRLRSAGFTEDQIRQWGNGGDREDRKDESDVRWDKAGGVREWDRGKVAEDNDDGEGRLSPALEFGRLKGT